jgi:aldehyde:ferredoxin oxidoreductase
MDTISAASTLACHAEIEGRRLKAREIPELLRAMAFSAEAGEELKLGSYQYACSKGRPEASISVKGLELPAYDPRGACGMALAYATSTRGGCHLRAYPISHEILRKPVATDRFSFSGKARIIKLNEDLNAAVDSLTACKFVFFAATLEEYAKALNGISGKRITAQDLLKTGERIYYNERVMNAMNGFSRKDDVLPERFFTREGSSGEGIHVAPISRKDFQETLLNYYRVRGLDEDGMPIREKCGELGIAWKS